MDLVGRFSPLKNMTSSVGMMTFPTEWKVKVMFQTTNQIFIFEGSLEVKLPTIWTVEKQR